MALLPRSLQHQGQRDVHLLMVLHDPLLKVIETQSLYTTCAFLRVLWRKHGSSVSGMAIYEIVALNKYLI